MRHVILILCAALLWPVFGIADSYWSLQLDAGTSHSFSTSLKVKPKDDHLNFVIHADYDTRPWAGLPYFTTRLGYWVDHKAWEVEMIHQKLYLTNPNEQLTSFTVTHGYNMIFFNRAIDSGIIFHFGGGLIIAHPEAILYGVTSNHDYDLAGFAGQLALEKRFAWGDHVFLSIEGKFTGAHASVSLHNADVSVPNVAFHALIGLGFRIGD